MAKYIKPHGQIANGVSSLARIVSDLEYFVIGKYRSVDIPDNVKKHIQDAYTHINSAIIQLNTAGRLLIEADAEESAKAKED